MNIWSKLKKIKIKDREFQNVPPRTAYITIVFSMIHFMVLGSVLTDLLRIRDYNWGIYQGLGLADSFQIPLLTALVILNGIMMVYGVYLYKHRELTDDEIKKKFHDKYD